MKKITLRSIGMICTIVVIAGFAGEWFQTVELDKSNDDSIRILRKTWWGLKTEQLEIGTGEWKAVKE